MGRRGRRQPPFGEKSPQSTDHGSGRITRSRSRPARSVTSPQSEMAPEEEWRPPPPEESRPPARKRVRRLSTPASAPTGGEEEGDTVTKSVPTGGEEEGDTVTMSVAPAARDSTEDAAADDFGQEFLAPTSASTAGGEEDGPVTKPVAPAANGSMEDAAADDFVPNSPILKPRLVEYDSSGYELEPSLFPDDPNLAEAYEKANQQYREKIGQLLKLPTLDDHTCIDSKAIEESSAETILKASKFILGLSSNIGGVQLKDCSGILMEWSDDTGIILTTANLICTRSQNLDVWLGGQEYALDAEVKVKLLHTEDIEVKGKLEYLDKQYGFALISAPMDQPKVLPRFSNALMFAGDIFLLGRDKWDLQVADGKILNRCPCSFQRHHYMHYDGAIHLRCVFGGALIDLDGDVIGMITGSTGFIHSSTILKCLHLLRTFNVVPRIHLGMKLSGIKCLNLISKEKISRKYNVNAGLIIIEVSGGSSAHTFGLRMGDIILAVNGECINTTIQLENMLLDVCKDCLEKGIGRDTDVDVTVGLNVFNSTKRVPGKIKLIAKLSRVPEIIEKGTYIVSNRDLSTSMSKGCSRSFQTGHDEHVKNEEAA